MSNVVPLEYNFLDRDGIIANTDYRQEMCLRLSDDTVIDMTTYSAKMQVRQSAGTTVIVEFSSADSSIVLSDSDPNIVLVKNLSDMNLTPGEYQYDLRLQDPDSKQNIFIKGRIDILANITDNIA